MKILYFTSTGNSLYIAKRLGGELLSIPQLHKDNLYEITDDIVGIISPTYWWGVPRHVREYLKNVKIKAEYIFTIMTYGMISMAASTQMKKLLEMNNIMIDYTNKIKMVDNFLPVFEMGNQIAKSKNYNIEDRINKIAKDIETRKKKILNHSFLKIFISNEYSGYNSEANKQLIKNSSKNFMIDESCISCGICREVCPVGNIAGIGKPEYLNKCEFCLGCIHLCPQNALHLKNEKSNKRFINPNIKLSEIIKSNRQI
jgi:ferredoxin/protein involved in ribonucleotide reduction